MTWTPENMLEIELREPDDFLKVKETLTRIGVPSKDGTKLYQTCHILHKLGRYFIVHFKEMFTLDGKPSTLNDNDIARRNTIGQLLSDWGLVDMIRPPSKDNMVPVKEIKIITFKDKSNWELVAKYDIG